jgi:hypothetical protein
MTVFRISIIALALVLTADEAAHAQGVFRMSPLFGIAQVYDSNLFSTPSDRQADFITRISPGVESDYRTPRLTLLGRYTLDVERFADHPELTRLDSRQGAAIEFTLHPTRRLALVAGTALSTTHTPGELNQDTGLTFTRAAARQIAARSSFTRQFGRVNVATMNYTFREDRLEGGVGSRTHAAAVGTRHRVSARDTVIAGYRVDQFFFRAADQAAAAMTSHALSAGWAHSFTRRTMFSIDAGPQIVNGSAASEVSASVRCRIRPVDLSLAYARTQTTIIGLAGTAHTQSVTSSAAWSLLRQSVQVQVSPGFFQSAHPMLRADVYRLAIDVAHPIADSLSLGVTLDMNVQHNREAALAHNKVARQMAMIRLVAVPGVHH